MDAKSILSKKKILADSPIFFVTAEEGLRALLEYIEEDELQLELSKLTRMELEKLLADYADCISLYHPDNYHQERGAILRNWEMLEKYGLSSDDYGMVDFW